MHGWYRFGANLGPLHPGPGAHSVGTRFVRESLQECPVYGYCADPDSLRAWGFVRQPPSVERTTTADVELGEDLHLKKRGINRKSQEMFQQEISLPERQLRKLPR